MKTILAKRGQNILVDDEDYEWLSQFSWWCHTTSGRYTRPARYAGGKIVFLVHDLMRPQPGMVVDHINGDPWDNRRLNLRVCSHKQNLQNRRTKIGKEIPFKGVTRKRRRFQASITADGIEHYLGLYLTAEEAARAYDDAALRLHGEFARMNFPVG